MSNDNVKQHVQLAKNKATAEMYLPTTKGEAYKIAESFAASQFCPTTYRNRPADVYIAMAYGAQIGLNPLLAVQNIAVVNGRPAVYGDALTAIVMGHPETEEYDDGYLDDGTAYCKIVRKGRNVYRTFSVEQAKKAGLWGKGTWIQYPERMLLWRAKGWAIRDAFADVLMGLWSYEEAIDAQPEMQNVTEELGDKKQPKKSTVEAVKETLRKARADRENTAGTVSPIVEDAIVEELPDSGSFLGDVPFDDGDPFGTEG